MHTIKTALGHLSTASPSLTNGNDANSTSAIGGNGSNKTSASTLGAG